MLSSTKLKSPCSSPDDADIVPTSPLFRRPSRYLFSKPSRHEDSDEDASGLPRVIHEPRPPKRPSICAFLTLPPISASPMCTPTSSVSSHSPTAPLSATDSGTTASSDTNPSCASELLVYDTPTWIATPPTPPSKPLRRSKTTRTLTRQVAFTPFIPSASFPALMQPHASPSMSIKLKRCMSLPILPFQRILRLDDSSALDASRMWNPSRTMSDAHIRDTTFSYSQSSDDVAPGPSSSRLPMFHLDPSEPPSDADDDSTYMKNSASVESHPERNAEDLLAGEKRRDAHRRYHALRELLSTELGYLSDLRALVTVYIRQLSTLTHRSLTSSSTISRASATFTSGPWLHSYTQLQAVAASTDGASSIHSSSSKDAPKSNHRPIFDTVEQEMLLRNLEDLLHLHESFVQELRTALRSLDVCMDTMEAEDVDKYLPRLEEAILCVATKFATEASRFNMYQSFCAGHSEAVDLTRRAMQQYPLDFETFETRSASMVSEVVAEDCEDSQAHHRPSTSRSSTEPPIRSLHLATEDRKRAMSLTSLDGAVRPQSLRPRASMVSIGGSATMGEPKREKQPVRRIAFLDYLIKPIQRICKYPLLLDQLLSSKRLRELEGSLPKGVSDINVVVESAAQAMRHVAALVDEARYRQDIAVQSSRISSRILLSQSPSPTPYPTLTSTFIASLGTCHLAGSLDTIHYHPMRPLSQTSNIKAKYLGAFLYLGGYLILVKVSKGKKYEPRHWMSLADFEVVDVEDDTATLPCSFKLVSPDQHFEFAAACKREKDAWLRSIRESLAHSVTWTNEPVPSYRLDSKGEILPNPEESLSGSISGHSAVPSIPEQVHGSDTDYSEPFFSSLRSASRPKKSRGETPLIQRQDTPTASRRSSSNSVKAIFSPMTSGPETVVIRRSSALARHQVDQELQDIISRSCLTARTHAFTNEEELFQPPKDGFARSNSTMNMARLSKHESVRIPRRRTPDGVEHLAPSAPSSPHTSSTSRRNTKNLRLSVISPSDKAFSPAASPPLSQGSSKASTTPSTAGSTSSNISFPSTSSGGSSSSSSTRPRSAFVRNVRGLFHFRPGSPSHPTAPLAPGEPNSTPEHESPSAPYAPTPNHHHHHRWRWDSHRRRPKSVHDEPVPVPGTTAIFEGPEPPFPTAPTAVAVASLAS